MKPFQYMAPDSIEEACRIVHQNAGDARVLAGGQSLIPLMKLNLMELNYIVDLKRIRGLSFIRPEEGDRTGAAGRIAVGALTTYADMERSSLLNAQLPLLSDTAARIGHPLVRNRGTIGGSLSHCDPAADLCATSLALDASIVAARDDGSRRMISAADFIKGPFATALEAGELVEKVTFPMPPKGTGHSFKKLTLGHGDFPLVVVSVQINISGGECKSASIALGGVADHAFRAEQAEDILVGRRNLGNEDLKRAAILAEQNSNPSSDLEVSAAYKKRMVRVLVSRALSEAQQRSLSSW